MIFFKKILDLVYSKYLLDLYDNDKSRVDSILEDFFYSLIRFNISLKILISLFLLFLLIINLIFIIIFFYKIRFNHFSKILKLASRLPYLKNLDNFLKANLSLHSS
mgnify:FL=1